MAERRSLIEGLEAIPDVDPELAADFIYNRQPPAETRAATPASKAVTPDTSQSPQPLPVPTPTPAPDTSTASHLTGVGRVPVGARVRTELAAALKRASLERQLQGIQPHSVQEILEDSLQLWLMKHGHWKS